MSAPRKVLVAGYGPFEDVRVNPGWEIAKELDGKSFGDARIRAVQIPSKITKNVEVMESSISRLKPCVIFGLGMAPGRAVLTPEKVALNILDVPQPDDQRNQTTGGPVVAGGPVAYLTTVPNKAIVKRMREAGIPSAISYSAGTHGCNQILYWMLHHITGRGLSTKVGFIHLPCHPQLVAKRWEISLSMYMPSMSLELMRCGVEIAISTSLEVTEDIELGCGVFC